MKVFPIDLEVTPRPYYASAFNDKHHGIDIFAPKGSNVFAVEDGDVRTADDPKGGTVAYLTTSDGTRYYYAHLDEYIGASPRKVKAGEVVGTVGTSGNAQGKAPHLHFQLALPEIGTVDPYQYLLDVDPKGREKKAAATAAGAAATSTANRPRAALVVFGALLVVAGAGALFYVLRARPGKP